PLELHFSYNLISVSIIDLTTNDIEGTFYVENLRIDRTEAYIIPSDQFNINYRYDITITSYDVFNQAGTAYSNSTQFTEEDGRLRPSIPSDLQLNSGDTEIYLTWNRDDSEGQEIEFYKIYRATFSFYVRTSDFTNIATISASNNVFTDYTVSNGTVYTYFITAVDIYGNESLNPVGDGYMPSGLISGNSTESASVSPPSGLLGVISGDDAELSWTASIGSFDGYEILRSNENNYSFSVIDYAPVSQITYTDSDALLKDGASYYYLVRKYRNEVDINVTSSSTAPTSSVLIGVATTTNGTSTVSINVSSVVNILNFEDPLIDKTNAAIDVQAGLFRLFNQLALANVTMMPC
ncbi:hypothetical protein LCGC14_2689020, partial [marine sediment metagenome]